MKYRVLQCILQVQQNIRERGVLTDSDMKENLRIPVGPQEGLERMNQIWLAQKSKEGQQCFKEVWEQWQRGGRKVHEETVQRNEGWTWAAGFFCFVGCWKTDLATNLQSLVMKNSCIFLNKEGMLGKSLCAQVCNIYVYMNMYYVNMYAYYVYGVYNSNVYIYNIHIFIVCF